MSISNPYSAPVVPGKKGAGGGGAGSGGTIKPLQKTRPWVIFLAILGLLMALLVFGLAILIMVGLIAPEGAEPNIVAQFVGGGVVFVTGLVYFIPAYLLIKYAMAIGEYVEQPSGANLSKALNAQMVFWRLIGIVTAIFLGLYVLLIGLALMLGMGAAMAN